MLPVVLRFVKVVAILFLSSTDSSKGPPFDSHRYTSRSWGFLVATMTIYLYPCNGSWVNQTIQSSYMSSWQSGVNTSQNLRPWSWIFFLFFFFSRSSSSSSDVWPIRGSSSPSRSITLGCRFFSKYLWCAALWSCYNVTSQSSFIFLGLKGLPKYAAQKGRALGAGSQILGSAGPGPPAFGPDLVFILIIFLHNVLIPVDYAFM